MWNPMKGLFGKGEDKAKAEPAGYGTELPWIEAKDNSWGIRLLDVRPLTQTMMAVTQNKQAAQNALSYRQDDGLGFYGQAPESSRSVPSNLRYPIDRLLADGVLAVPDEMEDKWALFFHQSTILFVRSWMRAVVVTGDVEQRDGFAHVTKIHGQFTDGESGAFTTRAFDFILRSYALNELLPAPVPPDVLDNPEQAAVWCMSVYGRRAHVATAASYARKDPERPLRTQSLLHIAVARGDIPAIEQQLAKGVPVDLLAADGAAPLHWSVVHNNPAIMQLLIDRGSPVDVLTNGKGTPLISAARHGRTETVRYLLDRGANVNAKHVYGGTALHVAAGYGHIDTVRLLLSAGAVQSPDNDGATPRMMAEKQGHNEIVALLG